MNSDDGALWSRSLAGDGEAFGVLFDRHRDRVYRHAYRLAQNRPDAEDVSAAAFLELWRQRIRVRLVECSVLPWLLVTTTNCALNVRRSRRRYEALLKSLPHAPPAADPGDIFLSDNPSQGVDGPLASALRALKPVDLQLITLVVLEGYDLASAAGILGLGPEAAKTRLHRARHRLREHLPGLPAPRQLTLLEEG
ncbi:RNA polymerase sigma factor [Arthrobacter zhaoguopingii]|uniref:RNA polymerase sigma factor n=1 Tax=Arthrobacter zhaoguopingii TaxID=2681491 RepID=UPI0013584C9B|nr:RNA polymerase sigma factor [Arthrobacter zhaoguopingii]